MNSTDHTDEVANGNVMEVKVYGKLSHDDYAQLVPETERLIRLHGKIRILVILRGFEGWDAGALWDDIKWNAQHFKDIERMAIVGETTAHRLMTTVLKSFTPTQVCYFLSHQVAEAREWLNDESVVESSSPCPEPA